MQVPDPTTHYVLECRAQRAGAPRARTAPPQPQVCAVAHGPDAGPSHSLPSRPGTTLEVGWARAVESLPPPPSPTPAVWAPLKGPTAGLGRWAARLITVSQRNHPGEGQVPGETCSASPAPANPSGACEDSGQGSGLAGALPDGSR